MPKQETDIEWHTKFLKLHRQVITTEDSKDTAEFHKDLFDVEDEMMDFINSRRKK